MIALDASVVIALLDADDAHHAAAVALLADEPTRLIMHTMTLAEVLVAPARAGRAQEVATSLQRLGIEVFGGAPEESLLLAELRVTSGLRMPDCCVLLVATVTGAALATFDQRMGAAARSRGIPVLP